MTTTTRPTIKLPRHLQESWEIVGGFSDPSKMPEFSWSTPAEECNVGGRLRLIPGSTCEVCYAKRGRYLTPTVHRALYRRLDCWERNQGPKFQNAFAQLVTALVLEHFRLFDAGDLASVAMLADFVAIAKRTPQIRYWLPTRELAIVDQYLSTGEVFPENLTVRVSAPMINSPFPLSHPNGLTVERFSLPHSSVFTDEHDPKAGTICRAYQNNGECGECRHCWDKATEHITYLKH